MWFDTIVFSNGGVALETAHETCRIEAEHLLCEARDHPDVQIFPDSPRLAQLQLANGRSCCQPRALCGGFLFVAVCEIDGELWRRLQTSEHSELRCCAVVRKHFEPEL